MGTYFSHKLAGPANGTGRSNYQIHLYISVCSLEQNCKKIKGYIYIFFIIDKIFNMQTWAKFDFSSQGVGK